LQQAVVAFQHGEQGAPSQGPGCHALDAAKGLDHLNVVEDPRGHRWGWLICLTCHRGQPDRGYPGDPGDPGSFTVWSTPEPSEGHAKQIHRFIARH